METVRQSADHFTDHCEVNHLDFNPQVPTNQDLEVLATANPWQEPPVQTMEFLHKLWDKNDEGSNWKKTEKKKKVSYKLKTKGSSKNFLLIQSLKNNEHGFWDQFWKQSRPDGKYLIVVPKKKLSIKKPQTHHLSSVNKSVPDIVPEQAQSTWNLMKKIAIMDIERQHYKELSRKLKSQLAEKDIREYWETKLNLKAPEAEEEQNKSNAYSPLGRVNIEPPTIEGLDKLGELVGHS